MKFQFSGDVAWNVVGRFYIDAKGLAFDAGIVSSLHGLPGPFFKDDSPDVSSAFFTFYAEKFSGTSLQNGNVAISYYPTGDWNLYLQDNPAGDWRNPSSFKGNKDQIIGTFSRQSTSMSTTVGTTTLSLLTFTLKNSRPFEWQGKKWDLKELFPNGVTQMGMGSPELLDPVEGYAEVKAFAGTGFAAG